MRTYGGPAGCAGAYPVSAIKNDTEYQRMLSLVGTSVLQRYLIFPCFQHNRLQLANICEFTNVDLTIYVLRAFVESSIKGSRIDTAAADSYCYPKRRRCGVLFPPGGVQVRCKGSLCSKYCSVPMQGMVYFFFLQILETVYKKLSSHGWISSHNNSFYHTNCNCLYFRSI